MRPSWDVYFMMLAKMASLRSTCNSRPTGAVIVRDKQILSTGYNGSMPGAPHCSSMGSDYCFRRASKAPELDKYNFCRSTHAEANAVARAAKMGVKLDDSTCYITLAPCYVCLKLLASAGVKHIYYEYGYSSTNKERDVFWKNAMIESPIETFEQLVVPSEYLEIAMIRLNSITSERKLKETF